MPPIADLEISLRREGTGYTVDLRFTPDSGGAQTHPIQGDPPVVELDRDALLQVSLDPHGYGQLLTGMLFADPRLRGAFAQTRAYVEGAKASLRLRLRLDPRDDNLHSIRWELLQDPLVDHDALLALSEYILFSRYLDSAEMIRFSYLCSTL